MVFNDSTIIVRFVTKTNFLFAVVQYSKLPHFTVVCIRNTIAVSSWIISLRRLIWICTERITASPASIDHIKQTVVFHNVMFFLCQFGRFIFPILALLTDQLKLQNRRWHLSNTLNLGLFSQVWLPWFSNF